MNAQDVITALKKKWTPGAHAWLENVRNGTGYGKAERYADALCVSCWPSRGIWVAGIEVKISRGDWLRELKAPQKSEPIQKYCAYWWIATPVGIVKPDELPETWGLIEVASKTKVIAQAPKLSPEPLSPSFVASVLRNAAATQKQFIDGARYALREEWDKEHIADLKLVKKTKQLERELEHAKLDVVCFTKSRKKEDVLHEQFSRRTGLNLHWDMDKAVALVNAAKSLDRDGVAKQREHHEAVAAALAALEANL